MRRKAFYHSTSGALELRSFASGTGLLLRATLVFCSLVIAVGLFPKSSSGEALDAHFSIGMPANVSPFFAWAKVSEADAAGLPSSSAPLEKEIQFKLTHNGNGARSAVATLPTGPSPEQTLVWTLGVLGVCVALILILMRRRPRRRRQKLMLDVGSFPIVLPHLHSKGIPGKQEDQQD